MSFPKIHKRIARLWFVWISLTVFVAVYLSLLSAQVLFGQQPGQRTFSSAEQAGGALFAAAQQPDGSALLAVLGPEGKDIVSSGDAVEDMNDRARFIAKYEQMHRLAKGINGGMTLYVGAENWPFPIPLVEKNGFWYFDTAAGRQEILMRRIGKNEVVAIDACHSLVNAEQIYRSTAFRNEHFYAERFVSGKGMHDGLFWTGAADELDSPLDPLIADAGVENTKSSSQAGTAGDPMPFNGYLFRILTGQGPHAEGGAKSYIVNGEMVGGFAFVAYPAEYRSSGVMTFVVNQDGVLYEKDLGPDTAKIAGAMTQYDPDSTWHRIDKNGNDYAISGNEGRIK